MKRLALALAATIAVVDTIALTGLAIILDALDTDTEMDADPELYLTEEELRTMTIADISAVYEAWLELADDRLDHQLRTWKA